MPISEDIDKLERGIEQLNKKYERFFSGVERKEPSDDRSRVENLARHLQGEFIANSGQSFRLGSITMRLTTYKTHWDRILREMEEKGLQKKIKGKIISGKSKL